jgi:hypothetical protein
MAIQQFRNGRFHNSAIEYYIRYDDETLFVEAVRCLNNYTRPAFAMVTLGENTFSDYAPNNGELYEFNIPPGILSQMEIGFDPETGDPTTVTGNFSLEYRA